MAKGWSPLANFVSAPSSFRQGVSRACALWVSYWPHTVNAFWGEIDPTAQFLKMGLVSR
jgi:hypothetical protein